ncbi:hypothetical protein EW026_g6054 [Hermanssonia centrifuga]|uniref:Phosphatidylglycerol/phosphatidylinositol transfer protein n=1 Tax=Hermanssonia centrifuga TaxID=98765 RepID=A0A4S4KDX5_9APHY|nr:hypothetical protein EW026_g6054 [Hermanssonia centrifuga]
MAKTLQFLLVALLSAFVCTASSVFTQETLDTYLKSDCWDWEPCGSVSDPLEIKHIEVSPDPPQRGQDLTVKVIGNVKEVIDDGAYADVTVKIGLIKILQKEFDLCEEAYAIHLLQLAASDMCTKEVTHTVTLPKEIPLAKFNVNVQGYTADDDNMVCVNLWIDFRRTSHCS